MAGCRVSLRQWRDDNEGNEREQWIQLVAFDRAIVSPERLMERVERYIPNVTSSCCGLSKSESSRCWCLKALTYAPDGVAGDLPMNNAVHELRY